MVARRGAAGIALRVRPLRRDSAAEIEWVAQRMRATLVEVLGAERGTALYDLDWLRGRVREHLDPARLEGEVWLAEDADGAPRGHLIARLERAEGAALGLIATVYVEPAARGRGLAGLLFDAGEAWLLARGAALLAYDTAEDHAAMLRLLEGRGYRLAHRAPERAMVRLAKPAPPA